MVADENGLEVGGQFESAASIGKKNTVKENEEKGKCFLKKCWIQQ